MYGNINTELGKVSVDSKVIQKVAGYTALDCAGIVGMAALSKRDGIVKLLTRNSLTKGIKVSITPDGVVIDFHVIIVFGVTISAIANTLFSSVKYQIENITGLRLSRINLYIEGVRVID